MNGVRIAVLLAATITGGWMAGLFYAYSISVMPALRRADPAVFVEVMQRINTAIRKRLVRARVDPAGARAWFEDRWVRLNHLRTLLCTGSFGSLCWALVQA